VLRVIDVFAYFTICGVVLLGLRALFYAFRRSLDEPVADELSQSWHDRTGL
jgi:hypothetical protein